MNDSRRPMFIHVNDDFRSRARSSSGSSPANRSPIRKKQFIVSPNSVNHHHHYHKNKRQHSDSSSSSSSSIALMSPPPRASILDLCHESDWLAVQRYLEDHEDVVLKHVRSGDDARLLVSDPNLLSEALDIVLSMPGFDYNQEIIVLKLLKDRKVKPSRKALGAAIRCQVPQEIWKLLLTNTKWEPTETFRVMHFGNAYQSHQQQHGTNASCTGTSVSTSCCARRNNDNAALTSSPIHQLLFLMSSTIPVEPGDRKLMGYFQTYIDTVDCMLGLTEKQLFSPFVLPLTMITNDQSYLFSNIKTMVEASSYALSKSPDRIYDRPLLTQCSSLHVALRMAGSEVDFCKRIMDLDTEHGRNLTHRNYVGDLPLHVACAAGVPQELLESLMQRLAKMDTICGDTGPNPWIWTTNDEHQTPIDLEWMRHIEGGHGLSASRHFASLPSQGIQTTSTSERMYRMLLTQAVDEVLQQPSSKLEGGIFDRILLIIKYAMHNHRYLLHSVSSMMRLGGPSIPGPILKLFHHYYEHEVYLPDDRGRLPLHHALLPSPNRNSRYFEANGYGLEDFEYWTTNILNERTASVADRDGRLPLHMALSASHGGLEEAVVERTVTLLVECHPDALDRRDPFSNLYPFQLGAAADRGVNCIYTLLRTQPSALQCS